MVLNSAFRVASGYFVFQLSSLQNHKPGSNSIVESLYAVRVGV